MEHGVGLDKNFEYTLDTSHREKLVAGRVDRRRGGRGRGGGKRQVAEGLTCRSETGRLPKLP